jgi:hypothetical protein
MVSIWPHLTIKNLLSFVVGGCVVVLAFIPLRVSAEHWQWFRWQAAIWIASGVAVVSLFVQAILQSKEDKERDQRDKGRDQREHGRDEQFAIMLRYMERHFGPLDSVNVAVTGISASITAGAVLVAVNSNSPQIHPDIKGEGKELFSKTEIIVNNRGTDVAHKIHVEPITLPSGIISFSKIETLAPGASDNITVTAKNTSGLPQHSITAFLLKDWDAKGQVTTEFPIPMQIVYDDAVHQHFKTTFALIYFPLKDMIKRNPFEIRNVEIRLLGQPVAP